MNVPERPPEWPELRVSEGAIDGPDADFRVVRVSPPVDSVAATDPGSGSARPGLGLRWCAGLAAATLLASAGAVGFAAHRGRTETTVRTVPAPAAGVDAGGCPRGDTCSALDGLYGGLAEAMNLHLPGNQQLFSTEMIDNSASSSTRRLRIVQLTDSGIRVLAISQCRPDRASIRSWSSGLSGTGPGLAVLVRSTGAGCSLALLAQVPAGTPVPAAALRAVAADPNASGG